MVSFCAPPHDNPDIPHIPTCHTEKPSPWTYIAVDLEHGRTQHTFYPDDGTESKRQAAVTACDCDNASGDLTTGTYARDNSRGGEAWEADTVSTNCTPVIQCREK